MKTNVKKPHPGSGSKAALTKTQATLRPFAEAVAERIRAHGYDPQFNAIYDHAMAAKIPGRGKDVTAFMERLRTICGSSVMVWEMGKSREDVLALLGRVV